MGKFRVCYHVGISTNVDHMLYWQMLVRMADMDTPLKNLTGEYPTTCKIITLFDKEAYDLLLYATADGHYELDRFMERVSKLLDYGPINVKEHSPFLDDQCMGFLRKIFSGFEVQSDDPDRDIDGNFQTIELDLGELKAICNIAVIL